MMKQHEILRKYRELRGFTQKNIADRLNMTHSGYSKYERGERKISIDVLFDLMSILSIPSSAFGNDDEFIENDYWITYEQQLHDLAEEYKKKKDSLDISQKLILANLFRDTFNRLESEKKKMRDLLKPRDFKDVINLLEIEDLFFNINNG